MNQFNLDKYDAIILDCDGVVIDINESKCLAFEQAVSDFPQEVVKDFTSFCRNSFGISRYEKFKVFFSDFAKIEFNEEQYQNMLEVYADICKRDYIASDLTENCNEALSNMKSKNKSLFIASGSDEKELNEVFHQRGLTNYFEKIYGSPKTKKEAIQLILENNNLDKNNVLFIGDAESDFNAANTFGIDFVYMSKYTIQSAEQDIICRENAIKVISSLMGILD